MHLSEFKAWFEGFTENMGGKTPTIKQWEKICKRVSEITADYTPPQVFIDRYWHPYRPYWVSTPGYYTMTNATSETSATGTVYLNATSDWKAAGNAEYLSVS